MLFALLASLALATPWRSTVDVTYTAAGWKNAAASALIQGELVGWSMRAHDDCTHTTATPFAVDKVTASGTATPTAEPPGEFVIAEKDPQTVVPSDTEVTFRTTFEVPMPFVDTLRIWMLTAGGTTCTYTFSFWGNK